MFWSVKYGEGVGVIESQDSLDDSQFLVYQSIYCTEKVSYMMNGEQLNLRFLIAIQDYLLPTILDDR